MSRNSTHEGRGPSSDGGCVVNAAAAGEVVVFNSSGSLSRGQMPSPVRLLSDGSRTIISFFSWLVIVADSCKVQSAGRANSRKPKAESPRTPAPTPHLTAAGREVGQQEGRNRLAIWLT